MAIQRRTFLACLSTFGLTSTLFPGVLWCMAEEGNKKITKELIGQAATLAGIEISDEYQEMMLKGLNGQLRAFEKIWALKLPNSVSPALSFDPVLPGMRFDTRPRPPRWSPSRRTAAPDKIEDLAFASVRELSGLLRRRKITSVALTEMFLDRLKRCDPILKFVVTLTTERALAQAKTADREIAAGKYRGPLHGVPWGAKDLLAVKDYCTTWGAGGFEEQRFDQDATVVQRLDAAGAVLLAKTTLGELAMGDIWFGGMTRNPWKTDQGSSGSSAGSASAVAAGCLPFAIGSETLGSIASPCTRCGTTGLRPTFGRVPRTGAMALCWSMDKLGPICRYVEDCAMVLDAIHGPDGQDRTVHDLPFHYDARLHPRQFKVGYLKSEFERKPPSDTRDPAELKRFEEQRRFEQQALHVLDQHGVNLVEVKLPDFPFEAIHPILGAEAAAAFDELTRSGRDKLLKQQSAGSWPNSFRKARFIPAVEYINANRARTLAMQQMAELFQSVDVIVAPTFSTQLGATNMTGHPAVIVPIGFDSTDGTPTSLTFLGNLFGEDKLLATARVYQDATEWHKQQPKIV